MWPVTDAFKAALTQSHEKAQRVEVLQGGEVKAVLAVVVDGSVKVARGDAIRRSVDLTLVDETGDLTPRTARDLLAPRGTELRVWRGIVLPGGPELVPLGTFRISKPSVSLRKGGLVVSVRGYDRMKAIQRARFWTPYTIASNTNVASAIQSLATSRMANLSFNLAATVRTTPLLVFAKGDDPAKALIDLADSAGQELFFDPMGVLTTRQVVDPATQPPVWTYIAGEEAILLDAEKSLDEEYTYNGVIVEGENAQITVRAEAWDTNSASPTYYDPANPTASTYGPVPYFQTSSFFTAQAQAQATADARLLLVKGMLERVRFSAVVNPAHDVGDVVRVTRPPVADALYSLESLTVPVRSGVLEATARAREL